MGSGHSANNMHGQHLWADLTSTELAALARNDPVAVLPLAAIEQHGVHLPLGTDVDIGEGIIRAALERLRDGPADACPTVLIMPTQVLGSSMEHASFPGTLSLAPELAIASVEAVGAALARAGIRRLVLFNSHGGNKAVVDIAALKLRAALGLLVVKASYFRFTPPADTLPGRELAHGLHGGALETAMMMYLAPEKVRREAIGDAQSLGARRADAGLTLGPEGDAGFAWLAEDLHASGVTGDARLADAKRGKRLVVHFAARLAAIIQETGGFDMVDFDPPPNLG